MLFHIPQAVSSIFILFRSVLFFVIWSCLFPVCAVLCVNCFCASIAACAMQQLPWILQPRSGYNLMQHYKCRVHFLASHSSVFHEGHDIRIYHAINTACFVYISGVFGFFCCCLHHMPFHKYLNAAKWKECSFCGSFHSWFINSGVIQSSNTGDKLPKSKLGSFFPRSPL